MSRYSPLPRNKKGSFYGKNEPSRKLQKSYTQTQGIEWNNRTSPSSQPYLEHIDNKSTEKKRSRQFVGSHSPVLMEQNRLLLTENQQMALLLQEKEMVIEGMERKYNAKLEDQVVFLQQVEQEKNRFVNQVLRHKESTDRQVQALESALCEAKNKLLEQEMCWKRERIAERQAVERERKSEVQMIDQKHQEKNALIESQCCKLKNDLEQARNQLKVTGAEHRQQKDKLNFQIQRLKEELSHSEHLRKLEGAELKQQFENKLQKLHLEHRKEKQLFLVEHETQVHRLSQELQKLRADMDSEEERMRRREETMRDNLRGQHDQNEKMESRFEDALFEAKEKCQKDKKLLQDLLEAENRVTQATSEEQIGALLRENQRLTELLALKAEEQTKIYGEIDSLRERYCADLEQHEVATKQLLSKHYMDTVGSQGEQELLKKKLAILREADLKGLKELYEHQLQVRGDQVQEKEQVLAATREKLHEQMRRKAQMRKQHELECSQLRSHIMKLNSKVDSLQAELGLGQRQRDLMGTNVGEKELKAERVREKSEQIRQEELNNLQEIITAKDLEIEQLENKMKLLKNHQAEEASQKQTELKTIQQIKEAQIAEKTKIINWLEADIARIKELLKQEKEEKERERVSLNSSRQQELQRIGEQFGEERKGYEQSIKQLKNEIRSLNLEVSRLKRQIGEEQTEKEKMTTEVEVNRKVQASREKGMLEDFYKKELERRQEEVRELRERNGQLACEVVEGRENYAGLEKKLESLVERECVRKQLEEKVMNMGKENNLAKNLTEILK